MKYIIYALLYTDAPAGRPVSFRVLSRWQAGRISWFGTKTMSEELTVWLKAFGAGRVPVRTIEQLMSIRLKTTKKHLISISVRVKRSSCELKTRGSAGAAVPSSPHSSVKGPVSVWETGVNTPPPPPSGFHKAPKHAAVFFTGGTGRVEFDKSVPVRRGGCLTSGWGCLRHGSSSRSCVHCGRRCCSSPGPPWWRRRCRRRSAGRPSGFLCCCQTGHCTGSSISSELPGPGQRKHISVIKTTVLESFEAFNAFKFVFINHIIVVWCLLFSTTLTLWPENSFFPLTKCINTLDPKNTQKTHNYMENFTDDNINLSCKSESDKNINEYFLFEIKSRCGSSKTFPSHRDELFCMQINHMNNRKQSVTARQH